VLCAKGAPVFPLVPRLLPLRPIHSTPSLYKRLKYWEIIADNLKKTGWSYGYVSTVDSEGRTIWIVDAHRHNGKRLVARADEKLTAFLELESAIRASGCPIAEVTGMISTAAHVPERLCESGTDHGD